MVTDNVAGEADRQSATSIEVREKRPYMEEPSSRGGILERIV